MNNDLESVPQAPLSPVLRGEGLGVRGENPRETHPLTPTPLPLSTGGEGLLGQTLSERLQERVSSRKYPKDQRRHAIC
jgi:hypothetical protein